MVREISKIYDPKTVEEKWYEYWLDKKYFKAGVNPDKKPYTIVIPPPNVTSILHMGHAFNNTLQDILIRFKRKQGFEALWLPGTDHAGIATQTVVERDLKTKENKSRHDLGREKFVERIWDWKQKNGNLIIEQLKKMGCSCDWDRERFTMDEGLSKAVQEVFIRLYNKGLIYKGLRIVNWDPASATALADDEVEHKEIQGHLYHIRYKFKESDDYLVVATTRPETLLGDTAVAIAPDDMEKYPLIGKKVIIPFVNREVEIIVDEHVDKEFGSGFVKVTPAHDPNDFEIGIRHHLKQVIVIDKDGRILPVCQVFEDETYKDELTIPDDIAGLDRFEARKKIIADLENAGQLEKIEKHTHAVGHSYRSHVPIEPYLSVQWFVKMKPFAEHALKAVDSGDIKFYPPGRFEKTYENWMTNIRDWCISRQLWWGHRIPAWYDDQGNLYVGRSEEEVRNKHGLDTSVTLRQDEDVLDTWFSSALWPFSTLGWPDKTRELNTFYPTSVLVTGFDIIFFWVARMIMMGLKFTGQVPFHEVYIHGLVRDAHGQKMSKSKGNILDPIDLIDGIELETLVAKRTTGLMQPEMEEKIKKATLKEFPNGIPAFGTDALRFTFAALASTGRDINFDMGRIEGYRNFCNKLWNAARYVLLNTEGHDTGVNGGDIVYSTADRWIISRLQQTEKQVTEAINNYRFDFAVQAIYEFTWNEYCDWYLELSKPVLQNKSSTQAELRGTRQTLVQVLETLLRLSHPIIPYISEEIWQRIAPVTGKAGDATIMLQPYPESVPQLIDEQAETEMRWVMEFVVGIRKIRSGMNIAPGKPLPVLLQGGSDEDRHRVQINDLYLKPLVKVESITWLDEKQTAPESATALLGDMKILIPMAGLIDKKAEIPRLEKEIEKLQKELQRGEAKLANPNFVEKAPSDVVEKERSRMNELRMAINNLQEQLKKIKSL